MSDDEIKHQMDFILKQQAVFSSKMIELDNKIDRTTENLDRLAAIVQHQAETSDRNYQRLAEEAEINRREMREAMETLIVGNEATRELANRAAQLAINVSQA
ncbi:MAG TPA: hypothetical protein VJX67_22850 [Blastocatellia bacterium]|nr:hypothetical protein [Blastocatellia bacterium]